MLVVNTKLVAVAVLLLVIAVMVLYNSKDKENVEGFSWWKRSSRRNNCLQNVHRTCDRRHGKRNTFRKTQCVNYERSKCLGTRTWRSRSRSRPQPTAVATNIINGIERIPNSTSDRKYFFDYGLLKREFNLHHLDTPASNDAVRATLRDQTVLKPLVLGALEQIEKELNDISLFDEKKSFPDYIKPHPGYREYRNFDGEEIVINGVTYEKFGPFHVNFFLSRALKAYKYSSISDMTQTGHARQSSVSTGNVEVDKIIMALAGHWSSGLFRLIHYTPYDSKYRSQGNNVYNSAYSDWTQFRHHVDNVKYNQSQDNCLDKDQGSVYKSGYCDGKTLYDDTYARTFSNLQQGGELHFNHGSIVEGGYWMGSHTYVQQTTTPDNSADFKKFVLTK